MIFGGLSRLFNPPLNHGGSATVCGGKKSFAIPAPADTISDMSLTRHDPVFYAAFGLSVLLHGWIFALWFITTMPKASTVFSPAHTVVTYFSKFSSAESEFIQEDSSAAHNPDIVLEKAGLSGDGGYIPALERNLSGREPDFLKSAKTDKSVEGLPDRAQKSSQSLSSEKITVPMLTSGPLKPEEYPDYFNTIGGRIKHVAQSLAAKVHHARGEVRVSFILEFSGRIREARVVEAASVDNPRLRRLALDSVHAAGPFPPFPDAHVREDVPFDVVIDFRLD